MVLIPFDSLIGGIDSIGLVNGIFFYVGDHELRV
jgi:hypothetical protein